MNALTKEEREFVETLRDQVVNSASAVVDYEDAGKLLCIITRLTSPDAAPDVAVMDSRSKVEALAQGVVAPPPAPTEAAWPEETLRSMAMDLAFGDLVHYCSSRCTNLSKETPCHCLRSSAEDIYNALARVGALKRPMSEAAWPELPAEAYVNGSGEISERWVRATLGALKRPMDATALTKVILECRNSWGIAVSTDFIVEAIIEADAKGELSK